MKFRVTFKTADAFSYAKEQIEKDIRSSEADDELIQEIVDEYTTEAENLFEDFTIYGEVVVIEFDTELRSAKVIKQN